MLLKKKFREIAQIEIFLQKQKFREIRFKKHKVADKALITQIIIVYFSSIIDRIDTVEDCCENIRVASSYVNSLAMKYQKEKLGIYKAIGKMNNQLVYEKLDNFGQNYLYTWLNINRDLKW